MTSQPPAKDYVMFSWLEIESGRIVNCIYIFISINITI